MSYPSSDPSCAQGQAVMGGPTNSTEGLTSVTLHARVILPPSTTYASCPFYRCFSIRFTDFKDLWSTVSPTSLLPLKFINSFTLQH